MGPLVAGKMRCVCSMACSLCNATNVYLRHTRAEELLALLKAGADRTKEVHGNAGWNAYKMAERAGHTVICDLLKE